MIDKTTKYLFGDLPREMGIPYRIPIYNLFDIHNIISENNGIKDIFISVYSMNKIIDKLFFDMDILDIELAGKFYKFLKEKFECVIPVFSGKKGFHFYVPLKPYRFKKDDEAKAILRKVGFSLVDESGMYKKNGENKISLLDTRIFGDINRLTRIPNTLRPPENLTYCTYLPEDFYEMGIQDFILYVKKRHEIKYNDLKRKYSINEIETTDAIYDYLLIEQTNYSHIKRNDMIVLTSKNSEELYNYLKIILRPCILNNLFVREPSQEIRTAATVDLLWAGFSPEEITEMYSKIGWEDFNERITRYQIEYLARKGLNSYKCKKLKQMGYCEIPNGRCKWW